MGLRKMAKATNKHDYWQLSRLSRWHVESEAMDHPLAIVSCSGKAADVPFPGHRSARIKRRPVFPSAPQVEPINMVNAKYGNEPGLKAYTHVNDQFAPFA